jgi:hypothetical protein
MKQNHMAPSEVRIRVSSPQPSSPSRGSSRAHRAVALPLSLGFLKDSINEVVYANYYLSLYESELRELAPKSLAGTLEASGPETPAQRAARLLQVHHQLEKRVQADLALVIPALENLRACGVARLEENVFTTRQLLADKVIAPNLSVLRLEQDGGVQSPFRDMDPPVIIDFLMQEPVHDEKGMHQAEKLLRNCVAVRDLQSDTRKLAAVRDEPASRKALEDAEQAAAESRRMWEVAMEEVNDAGPFSTLLRVLDVLQAELSERSNRLANLKPKSTAYCDTEGTVQKKVDALLPSILAEDSSHQGDGISHPGTGRVAMLFREGSALGQLAESHGLLPVAQALREAIARLMETGDEPEGNGLPRTRGRLDRLPEEVGLYIRQHVQRAILGDESLRTQLTRRAMVLCNHAIAEELSRIATRLDPVEEPEQHRILSSAEALDLIQATVAKFAARAARASHGAERAVRHPVIALLSALGERIKDEVPLIDGQELEFLLDMAVDYVRRRMAFHEQAAMRSAYVERGWTLSSRQRRMERVLGEDTPTAFELSRIDAELTELFEAIQGEAELFPNSDETPLTATLHGLMSVERDVRESLRDAVGFARKHLGDPEESPVIAELMKLPGRFFGGAGADGSRIATLADLAAELHRITNLVRGCVVPRESESAVTLCRKSDLSPESLAGLAASTGALLPIARYVAARFGAPPDMERS